MGELTREELEAATKRGEARMRGPRAESARYDAGRRQVVVGLTTGIEIVFAPCDVEGLQDASVDDLNSIEVEAFGLALHFPRLDVDLYDPALIRGRLGSKRWMAARAAAARQSCRAR